MNIIDKYKNSMISAVIRTDDCNYSLNIAKSLIKGGIDIIEITIENPLMYNVIEELCDTTDAAIVAGGVITARQAQEAIKVGAKAIVSPIFQPNLIKLCQTKETPVITTATTPNEAYQAWKARVPLIKIFPSQQMGGAIYIQDLLRPMPFLNVIATGNVLLEDFHEYLEVGATAVTIGRDFWQYATYEDITSRAQAAVEKINAFKELKK